MAINEARKMINEKTSKESNLRLMQPKIKKLEVPMFYSDHRYYHKWKEQFERYTKELDDEARYDYMFAYTKGEAHEIIRNKRSYKDAIKGLDKEFGNETFIMKLLIEDIRAMPGVKKGDYKSFEKLACEVNGFKDRLLLLGKDADIDNTYVLQEIESKMSHDDQQNGMNT